MQRVSLMLVGTVVAGTGFGAAFSGSMRTVIPQAEAHERAGLLSTFYVEGYLSLSVPAILAGLVAPLVGLPLAADVYGAVLWRSGDCAGPRFAAGHAVKIQPG